MHLEIPTEDCIPAGVVPDHLVVERNLYEAEAPILFLTRNNQGQLLLAYLAEDSESGAFTILTPVTDRTIALLEKGVLSVRDAIESAPSLLHWIKGVESKSWALDITAVPVDRLPRADTPLFADQEPVLRTRAVGQSIVMGRTPASVVAFVADSTRKAMKVLLDYTLDARSEGRPTDQHRTLYDLPIQGLRFASFEMSFGVPADGFFTTDQVRHASEKLSKGLHWASQSSDRELEAESPEEREAILRATLWLTPPSWGNISQVEVSGSWISGGKVTLTAKSRKRVSKALRRVDSERIVVIEGRLGEIDADKLTFTLRDTSDGQERNGSFSEDLLEEMIALLTEQVEVAGIERQGRLNVAAVAPAAQGSDPERVD